MRSELPSPEGERDGEPADLDLWTAEDLSQSRSELMYAASCFISTRQADEEPEDGLVGPVECDGCPNCTGEEHGRIEADVIHDYVLDRIEAEPDLMQHSIIAMREDDGLEPEIMLSSVLSKPEPYRPSGEQARPGDSGYDGRHRAGSISARRHLPHPPHLRRRPLAPP